MASEQDSTPDSSGSPEDINMDDEFESSPPADASPLPDRATQIRAALGAAAAEGLTQNLRRFLGFLHVREGEWTELQALHASGRGAPYRGQGYAHARTVDEVCGLALTADEHHLAQGIYIVTNGLDTRVSGRGEHNAWLQQQRGTSTQDRDILVRRAVYIDCDPERPSGTSANEAEARAALDRAVDVYLWLAGLLGDAGPLGLGMSGNGCQVYVALDRIPENDSVKRTVNLILRATAARFSDNVVEIDTSVGDAKRICPAFGTTKRKGNGEGDRPHRRTYFACSTEVRRLTWPELEALASAAGPATSASRTRPRASTQDGQGDDGLRTLNDLPIRDVAVKLGLDEEHPVCPWCGHGGERTDVAYVEANNNLNCKHPECSERPSKTGIDLVAKVAFDCNELKGSSGIVPKVMTWFAENMGLDVRKSRKARSRRAATPVSPTTAEAGPDGEAAHDDQPESAVGGRPEIVITTEEHEVNSSAATALVGDASLFQRGHELVRILRAGEDESADDRVKRTVGTPKISRLHRATLRERMTLTARWLAAKLNKGEFELVPAHPPSWAVDAVLNRGNWSGIRSLVGITEVPVLRPDGSVLGGDANVYDPATGLMYLPNARHNPIPNTPTRDDARASCEALLEVVCDVPFETEAHRSAWLSGLLTPFARPAFEGPSPVTLVDANVRGAGKNLILDAIGVIVTGREMSRMADIKDADELDKRVTSIALSGDTMILVDNIRGGFGGRVWEAVATSTWWRGRRLGVSEDTVMPLRLSTYGTGNNIEVIGDMSRRVIHIRLASKDERPENRDPSTYRHPELLQWVRDQRPRLVAAALTVLRAYVAADKPQQSCRMGSFEGWAGLVASAIVWCGYADPCETREAVEETSSSDRSKLGAVLATWFDAFGDEPQRLSSVLRMIDDEVREAKKEGTATDELRFSALDTALTELAPDGRRATPQQLGKIMGHLRGRVVNGSYLDNSAKDRNKNSLWRVLRAGDAGDTRVSVSGGSAAKTDQGAGDAGDAGIDSPLTKFQEAAAHLGDFKPTSVGTTGETIPAIPASPAAALWEDRRAEAYQAVHTLSQAQVKTNTVALHDPDCEQPWRLPGSCPGCYLARVRRDHCVSELLANDS